MFPSIIFSISTESALYIFYREEATQHFKRKKKKRKRKDRMAIAYTANSGYEEKVASL